MKLISVVTPCYNEEENVRDAYEQVKQVFDDLKGYDYEHIFIDNASKDKTVQILKEIALRDQRVKIIVNARNFGQTRSPYHAQLVATGDAVIIMLADLQDPPEKMKDLIKKWEEGYKIVVGIKTGSEETRIMYALRTLYYSVLRRLSDTDLLEHFSGFSLCDRHVMDILRTLSAPNPYFRGLISEIGFEIAKIEYTQAARKKGLSKNNFLTLFDIAMLGMVSYSKIPLRLATMLGFLVAALSLVIALVYFVYKLLFWSSFSLGLAPLVIGIFFFSAVQLLFLGIVGEYVGSIYTQVLKRPLVVEKERINFPPAQNAETLAGVDGRQN